MASSKHDGTSDSVWRAACGQSDYERGRLAGLREAAENAMNVRVTADGAPLQYVPPLSGVWYDAAAGAWVARHVVMSAGRTEAEAREALASAIKLIAGQLAARAASGEGQNG
jgi:hypothetical protein